MSQAPLLLDTCALIWIAEGEPISDEAQSVLEATHEAGGATLVSPISAWEIGLLAARERLKLLVSPERWFTRVLAIPGVQLAPMSTETLIASSFLPGTPPRDPADRIIAATARDQAAILLTRDGELIDYAGQGHIRVTRC